VQAPAASDLMDEGVGDADFLDTAVTADASPVMHESPISQTEAA
jgi:hypothetical protein